MPSDPVPDPVPGPVAAERNLAAVVAHLLGTGRGIAALSAPLTVAAFAGMAAALFVRVPAGGLVALLVAGLAGLAGQYVSMRVRFDAALFRDVAESRSDFARIDGALSVLGLLPAGKAGRAAELRASGAMRLMRWQAALLCVQAASLVAACLAGALAGQPGGVRP